MLAPTVSPVTSGTTGTSHPARNRAPGVPRRRARAPVIPRRAAGQGPPLVRSAVAVPDLQLGAVGTAGAGDVQAAAGLDALQGPVRLRRPLLVGSAVAVPQVDERAVGRALAGDVHALAGRSPEPALAVAPPPRLGGAAVAVPALDLGAARGRASVVVDALAGQTGPDRADVLWRGGARCQGEVVELVGLVAGDAEAGLTGGVGGVGCVFVGCVV